MLVIYLLAGVWLPTYLVLAGGAAGLGALLEQHRRRQRLPRTR
jgi:hypothetical protein